jgi:hypothetical protein
MASLPNGVEIGYATRRPRNAFAERPTRRKGHGYIRSGAWIRGQASAGLLRQEVLAARRLKLSCAVKTLITTPPIHLHRQLAANLAWRNLKAGSGRLLGEGRQVMSGLSLLHARPRQLDGLDQMWSWNNLTYASGGGGTEWRRLAPQACDGGRSNQVTGTSPKPTHAGGEQDDDIQTVEWPAN